MKKHLFRRATVLAAILVMIAATIASAVHDEDLFELGLQQQANILGDGSNVNGPDWADIFTYANGQIQTNLNGGSAAAFLIDDLAPGSGIDRTTFGGAGGSNKNPDPLGSEDCASRTPPLTGSDCNTWHWDAGNNPPKDDLSNVYAWATFNDDDHLVLYAGFERLDPSGDSYIDIEFLRDDVALDEAVPCNDPGSDDTPCEFTGVRSVGDIIVSMNFERGGAIGSVTIREWDGDSYEVIGVLGGEGCNADDPNNPNDPPADSMCAFNNGTDIDGGTWPNYDNHAAVKTQLEPNAFTEFGIDVTALEGGDTPCISTVIGKTRSSSSFTAELKDFAGPQSFPICSAAISIAPDDVNEVGESHVFTATVSKKIGSLTQPANDGTQVVVKLTSANGATPVVDTTGADASTCDVDANGDGDITDPGDWNSSVGTVGGTCTVKFASSSVGTVTAHASASVTFGGQTFNVQTNGVSPNSGDAVKRFVDARISIAPNDTNSVGENHTFTVTVEMNKGDGNGWVNAPDGTAVTVALTDGGGAINSISSNTCASPGTSTGTCSVTFTSNTAGTVTGHASTTFSISTAQGNESVFRETNGQAGNSGDATKIFVSGSIAWTKVDNANVKQGGATFDVCRTHNLNSSTDPDTFDAITPSVCFSVTDNSAPDTDADVGEFKVEGLRLGKYTVRETTAPPGFEPDPDTVNVQIDLVNPNATISTAFVNNRPIVKITGFGYTNLPAANQTSGIVSGTTTYTVNMKNFGGASTTLTNSSLTVTSPALPSGSSLSCAPASPQALAGTLAPNGTLTFTMACTYTNIPDNTAITAALVVNYTTNNLARQASGSPATIVYTVQAD